MLTGMVIMTPNRMATTMEKYRMVSVNSFEPTLSRHKKLKKLENKNALDSP
jgi:hypothetical protein